MAEPTSASACASWVLDLIRDVIGIGMGAFLGFWLGIKETRRVDLMREAEDLVTAIKIIEDETREMAGWRNELLGMSKERQGRLVQGYFVPVNSLVGNLPLLMRHLRTEDVIKIKKAYVTFEKYDRIMKSAVEAGALTDESAVLRVLYWYSVESPKAAAILDEALSAIASASERKKR
jgi:hypothetical protein